MWQDRAKTVPLNLTGFTAKLEIKAVPIEGEDPDVLSLTTENDKITITALEGKIEWVASEEDTADLEGEYSYELFMAAADGESTSILKGLIQISPARAD